MQTLSAALQGAEARNSEQTALLLAAESRERQAATDAEVARHAIEEARAEIVKLSLESHAAKEHLQGTIDSLQLAYQEAADAQAVAEHSLRAKSEELVQLHTLLEGVQIRSL